MAFGAFAPLPIRLGGGPRDGWTPEQHARLSADLVAAKRSLPFARVRYSRSGGSGALEAYRGRNGTGVLSDAAPTITFGGLGDTTLTWPTTWEDSTGRVHTISITGAKATAYGTDARICWAETFTRNSVRILTTTEDGTPANTGVSVRVFAQADGAIGDYGGATDKKASTTEGSRPYAYLWHREMQASRGSAYTTKPGTLVHAENLAMARMFGWLNRQAEKLTANSLPATADEKLEYWADVLGVTVSPNDERWQIRQRCAAKYQAASGPTASNTDSAIQRLLGQAYVASWRQVGASLSVPPTLTFWPGINPGPLSYALSEDTSGNLYAWLSERCHLTVEVQQVALDLSAFLKLMNVDLFELLDRMLPATATFDWALAPLSSGFLLDISQLDFHGITP